MATHTCVFKTKFIFVAEFFLDVKTCIKYQVNQWLPQINKIIEYANFRVKTNLYIFIDHY